MGLLLLSDALGQVGLAQPGQPALPGPGSGDSWLKPSVCVSSQSGTSKFNLLSAREAGGPPL